MKIQNGALCSCGKRHSFSGKVILGAGVIDRLPQAVTELGGSRVFLLVDTNTYRAAGCRAEELLLRCGISVVRYCFAEETVEPDEKSVGSAIMHYDPSCDIVVAAGSGVINDIGKLLSVTAGKPYIIVATAPSMDGYASASSSMTRDGLKISLPSKSADCIIGDTDILRQAPMHMLKSGLGDMLAKYVSICEWRISHMLTGEYYCEAVADMIRQAVGRCVEAAPGLLRREPDAVEAVFQGLVMGGIAMNYAGLSRPASGVEHYISHVLDMRGVEFGTTVELHGIQCAVGTLMAVKLYEKLKAIKPDREKASKYVADFNLENWNARLREYLGRGAESMISLERTEGKYDKRTHPARLERIIESWDSILSILDEELLSAQALEDLLRSLQMPTTPEELGVNREDIPTLLKATKDIRDKYVLTRLLWDLGLLDELTESK